ncbi:hypothetical protein KZ386_02150 [Glaesserella parasuis]|uniref:Phage protein n=1 Tax=Glaesserella parasuis HPS9 TaxID=1450513 RepID=A0A836MBV8_GLAPU|nr:DUF6387 family protein [Glaesserella parasuis]KDB46291.1 hypothetical protein HPS9_05220 [Glaesserella parasuis HPS9]MCT8846938.1 hypothetical protein [Glaesserella parasuis]MCT8848647.1 hypothetical protein [Glaesserella parasuis]MDG6362126.1 DUF6387 family protein [Glaesserella parasuis]MDG6474653.1 DUF6387 family protein [Glaesserella parasuis]
MNRQPYCPDWFNLEDYDRLSEISRSDWNNMVFCKFLMLDSLNKQEHKMKNYNLEFMRDFFIFSSKNFINGVAEHKNAGIDKDARELNNIIKEFDFLSLAFYCEEVFLSKNKQAIEFLEKLKSECENPSINFSEAPEEYKMTVTPMNWLDDEAIELKNAISIDGNVWMVDTSYSDDAIIDAVKEKLKQIRKGEKGKILSDAEIESLIKFRVIPYIDLWLWSKLTGTKLTDQNMADILFFDDPDGKGLDTIRKTTKKKAMMLLSNHRPKFI